MILCGVGFRLPAEMHRIHHTNSFLVFCLHTAADGALKTTRTSVPVTLSCFVLSSPHLSRSFFLTYEGCSVIAIFLPLPCFFVCLFFGQAEMLNGMCSGFNYGEH